MTTGAMMSTYFFRPTLPGVCASCGQPYPAWVGRMHLTANGIVHPGCDPDMPEPEEAEPLERKDLPSPPERMVPGRPAPPSRPRRKQTPPRRAQLRVLRTETRPEVERTGGVVCRKCWTVHASGVECRP